MADNVWDIVVGVQNKAELDELNRAIEVGEKRILAYKAAMDAGKITQEMYAGASRSVAASIQQASARIQEIQDHTANLGKAGAKAGYGLLQLGYAADDIQYGFKSIVNNIPQIAIGLGAGAGLAGATAVAAVAVNTLVNHWEELIRLFNQAPYSIQGAKSAMETITEGIGDAGFLGPGGGGVARLQNQITADQAADDRKRAVLAARGQGLRDKFGDMVTKDQAKQGGLFKEALAEYGPERLQGHLEDKLSRGKKDLSPTQRKNIADFATNLISDALNGKTKATDYEKLFGAGFVDKYEEMLGKEHDKASKKDLARMDREADKVIKEEDDKRKRVERNLDRRTEEDIADEKSLFDAEKQEKIDALEAKKEQLEGLKRGTEEGIHAKQPHFGTFSSVGDMIKGMQEERFNRIPKESLDKLKEIKAGIDDLNKGIRDARGAKFG